MSREIKFRGKSMRSGEWVYGSLYTTSDGVCIITTESPFDETQVIPETVGQYIGIRDINGREIYKDDIALTQEFEHKLSKKVIKTRHLGVVVYEVRSIQGNDYSAKWKLNIKDLSNYKNSSCNWGEFFKCEVVGNIHDNSELLN